MKLKQLEVKSFAGINPNSPVVLDFSNSKWVTASGDMGVGKTSLLNALLVACGQLSHTGQDGKNYINQETDKIDINFSFVGNDRFNYDVRCTKSKFELTYEGENVKEPITKMKELLGVVGVSPMDIKNKRLKDIVKWLSSYSKKSAEEFEAQMVKYKNGIKQAVESRASANRSMKALNEYLSNEAMFLNWEESEKKYAKPVDIKQLSASLEVAGKNSDKLIQAETKIKQLHGQKVSLTDQIANLQRQLDETEKAIKGGEKFIEENKGAKKEYDTVKARYDNAHTELMEYNKWQGIKQKKSDADEFETLSQQADATEKEFIQSVKELQTELLPDIKGVELVLEDTHEEGNIKKEGLYWNGLNVAQMSETEWWDIVLLIWRKYKVKIIVIDNYSNLGSGAVEILEKLVKDGCYVLAAEMDRETKTLSIEYK